MIEKPWLSILVPVYNVAPYLVECVASIIDQCKDPGIEIILLDDCSTDDSFAICKQLRDHHNPMIRLHAHEKNRGLSAARNTLLEHARGDYIWFIDSDDVLFDGALKRLREIVSFHGPDIISFNYRKGKYLPRFGFRGRSGAILTNREMMIAGLFKSRKMYSWLKVCKRSLWTGDLRFPIGRYFEDQATTPRLLLRAQSFFHEPRSWIFYRVRPGSIMSSVVKSSSSFDYTKHDDMAVAMAEFHSELPIMIKKPSPDTLFWVAHFMAREYRKLAKRLVKAGLDNKAKLALIRYHDLMQENAPMSFAEVERQYLRWGKFYNWYQLRRLRVLVHALSQSTIVIGTESAA